MPDRDVLWQYVPRENIVIEALDLQAAVYMRPTGETHILSTLPAEILIHLMTGEKTEQGILQAIANAHGLTSDADWRVQIHTSLMKMQSLDLVESSTP